MIGGRAVKRQYTFAQTPTAWVDASILVVIYNRCSTPVTDMLAASESSSTWSEGFTECKQLMCLFVYRQMCSSKLLTCFSICICDVCIIVRCAFHITASKRLGLLFAWEHTCTYKRHQTCSYCSLQANTRRFWVSWKGARAPFLSASSSGEDVKTRASGQWDRYWRHVKRHHRKWPELLFYTVSMF